MKMHTTLYRPPSASQLLIFRESDQQIRWPAKNFDKDTILLYLQDYDLCEEDLKTGGFMGSVVAETTSMAFFAGNYEKYVAVAGLAKKELKETGKINGFLFLTPCLQKVWVSHYDMKYLEKISCAQP